MEDVDGQRDAGEGENDGKGDRDVGWPARLPRSLSEAPRDGEVLQERGDENRNAEYNEHDTRRDGVHGGALRRGVDFAKEETEAADGEADAHEPETGANPGEEGAFGGEVDAWVLVGVVVHTDAMVRHRRGEECQ